VGVRSRFAKQLACLVGRVSAGEQYCSLNTLRGGLLGDSRLTLTLKGNRLTTPERKLIRGSHRHQMLDDDRAMDRLELDTPERENAWVKDFISRLSDVLRNISKR
jgi:hypothetical protein